MPQVACHTATPLRCHARREFSPTHRVLNANTGFMAMRNHARTRWLWERFEQVCTANYTQWQVGPVWENAIASLSAVPVSAYEQCAQVWTVHSAISWCVRVPITGRLDIPCQSTTGTTLPGPELHA
jgi:hypothetical protein